MRRDRTWIVVADGAHVAAIETAAGDPQLPRLSGNFGRLPSGKLRPAVEAGSIRVWTTVLTREEKCPEEASGPV